MMGDGDGEWWGLESDVGSAVGTEDRGGKVDGGTGGVKAVRAGEGPDGVDVEKVVQADGARRVVDVGVWEHHLADLVSDLGG